MAYTLGKPKAIPVEGITFLVKSTWGAVKALQQETKRLQAEGIDITDGSRPEMIEFTEKWLDRLIVGWTGVVDEEGNPVAWSIDLVDELDPAIISEVLNRAIGGPDEKKGSEPMSPASS